MPEPLDNKTRWKVVRAVRDEGMSYDETAARFAVGRASVSRVLRRFRETGGVEPRPMGGRRNGITDGPGLAMVKHLVEEKPDRTGEELVELFEAQTGRSTSRSAISRAIKKLGFVRKKKKLVAKEQNAKRVQLARHFFQRLQEKLDPRRLVFIDETGTHIAMARRFGRAPAGVPVHDHVPRNRGNVLTLLGALRLDGLIAALTVEGGTTTEVFCAFLEQVLLPKLTRGDILVMDNQAAHHSKAARDLLIEARVGCVFLPPYSPEFNPIEMAWSKLKGWLQTARARTVEALNRAIGWGIDLITPEDARGFVRHAGYSLA